MGSCTRINIVYSWFLESLPCWFNYKCALKIFFFWRGGFVWSIFDKIEWSVLWTPSGLKSRNTVNKAKSRCRLKTLWKIQGRCCWSRNRQWEDRAQWKALEIVTLLLFPEQEGKSSQPETLPCCLKVGLRMQVLESGVSLLIGEPDGHWEESSWLNQDTAVPFFFFFWLQLTCTLAELCVCCWNEFHQADFVL